MEPEAPKFGTTDREVFRRIEDFAQNKTEPDPDPDKVVDEGEYTRYGPKYETDTRPPEPEKKTDEKPIVENPAQRFTKYARGVASTIDPRAADAMLSAPVQTTARWVDRYNALAARPGSIALLLGILIFAIFAMVPVGANGETRLLLMVKALTGGTHLPESQWEQQMIANANQDWGQDSTAVTDAVKQAEDIASVRWMDLWG